MRKLGSTGERVVISANMYSGGWESIFDAGEGSMVTRKGIGGCDGLASF